MTIEDLKHITTTTRRKIKEMLRWVRHGSRTLAALASAAEVSIHENDHDAAAELESVYRQIQALQAEAEAIERELNQ